MKRAVRHSKFSYALALILCFAGVGAFGVVLYEAWPEISSSSEVGTTFWEVLWTRELAPVAGVRFSLMALAILSAVMLTSGAILLLYGRKSFFLPEKTMTLQCPFCKKQWRARFPEGQGLCPHCRHRVHPTIAQR